MTPENAATNAATPEHPPAQSPMVTTRVGDVEKTELAWRPGMPTPNLNGALSKAQGEFPTPPKRKTANIPGRDNKVGYSYKYADLADVIETCKEIAARHGLCHIERTRITDKGNIVLITTLRHESGEEIDSVLPIAPWNRPQDLGASLTYFRRYLLCGLLGVAAEEDTDGRTGDESGDGKKDGKKVGKKDESEKPGGQPAGKPGDKATAPKGAAAHPTPPPGDPKREARKPGGLTDAQIKRLYAIAKSSKWGEPQLTELKEKVCQTAHWRDLSTKQYDWVCNLVEHHSYDEAARLLETGALSEYPS